MKATRLGLSALARARSERRAPTAAAPRLWRGLCLAFTRTTLGVDAKHPSAIEAWRATPAAQRHDHDDGDAGNPPPGVPLYWSGGKYGHVALSAGNGWCWSTDIRRRGKVDRVRISLIHQRWGLAYLGWCESINGVRVYPPTAPTVSVSRAVTYARLHGRYDGPVARALQAEGLIAEVSGYARWQHRLGYRGRDADGYAGIRSLRELGSRHGFKVVP